MRSTLPITIPPGVVRGQGPLASSGRWTSADKIRFVNGRPEKIGGWDLLSEDSQADGVVRGVHAWSDLNERTVTALGSHKKLQVVAPDDTMENITPYEGAYEIPRAFTTVSGSATITVYLERHGLLAGSLITFDKSVTVGGAVISGNKTVAAVVDANTFTFSNGTAASSTEATPQGTARMRVRQPLTNAFSTTNGSTTVTVTHASHGKIAGQTVTFVGGSASAGGLTMAGTWVITDTPTTNTYTFTHTSAATSTAGPTGSTTDTWYEIRPGEIDPTGGFGWGIGDYGAEDYGTPRSATNLYFQPHYWTFDHFGRVLTAAPYEGSLYTWDPTESPQQRAYRIATAPGAMRGTFMTPERFVVAWGASADTQADLDPMLVRWCSQADYWTWTPAPDNSANSRRLTEGKYIMGAGAIGAGFSMIWTDSAAYSMRYTGSRYVFETRLVAKNAGLVGPTAWCEAQGRAFWYSPSGFYAYGSGMQSLPNQEDFLPWLQKRLRSTYLSKTVCFYNAKHNEVWWLFVVDDDTEPALYVAHNLGDGSWTDGVLARTAAYTPLVGADPAPRMVAADGYIYLHERGNDDAGLPMACHIESGPFQVAEGEALVTVLGFIPDFAEQEGAVDVTFTGHDRAPTQVIDTATKSLPVGTGLADVKFRARTASLRLSQTVVGGRFALGRPAVQIQPKGKKR